MIISTTTDTCPDSFGQQLARNFQLLSTDSSPSVDELSSANCHIWLEHPNTRMSSKQKNFTVTLISHTASSDCQKNWRGVSEHSVINSNVVCDYQRDSTPSAISSKTAAKMISIWELSGQGKLASFYVVYYVEQSFKLREYKQVNSLLAEVDVKNLTEWSMIALLRSSFSARSFLPAWQDLLSSVRAKLQNDGKNTDRLLRGLNR